jgi:TetR/AcrR family transcriptional regulator, cholesterol catabolism regulator
MEARDRILIKAHELFHRFGIRRVTMDEIALKTGMSKKTIYQSFANKDELVEAVLDEHLKKNLGLCEVNKSKADNAIQEIFLNIDTVQELMTEMNPTIFHDLEKFHPSSFLKLFQHKNNYLFKTVKENLEWGIKDGLYREDINVDVITKFRLETMFLPFNQDVFPYGKYNLADVEKQSLEHYLYGIATVKAHKLIDKYKQQRLKTK